MILRGEPGSPERLAQIRGDENAERIARAKGYAGDVQGALMDGQRDLAIAYALGGLLEIAIVRADVRSYEPPF